MGYKQKQVAPPAPLVRSEGQNGSAKGAKTLPNGKQSQPESPHAALLNKVRTLIEAGKAEEAFDLINARGPGDAVCKNARAVCLLKMNQPDLAVRALREICLTAHGTMLREDIPSHYVTNLAAALFAAGNVAGCVAILEEFAQPDLPRVQVLRTQIKAWESKLSFWQRFKWKCGIQPPVATGADSVAVELG